METKMRKTGLLGIFLLCALTAARPAKAFAEEVPAASVVEAEATSEEVSELSTEEDEASSETAVSDPAQEVQAPAENNSDLSDISENESEPIENSEPEDESEPIENSEPENETEPIENSEPEDESESAENSALVDDTGLIADSDPEITAETAAVDSVSGTLDAKATAASSASSTEEKTEDRIHFITLNGSTGSSDSFLIESNGLYGLIDSSNPSNLSDTYFDDAANGQTVVKYLTDLNVSHLNFVLATHSHSDHIGGMPDVAASGLVNSSTVYIYKAYEAAEVAEWKNDYYAGAAVASMKQQGAALLNLLNPNQSVLNMLGASITKDSSDRVGDHLSFTMGDFLLRLFNLHTESVENENLNSIVTTVQKGNARAVLMADMEMTDYMESRTVNAIVRNDGTTRTDVYKVGHHNYDTSTSMDTLNTLRPTYCVQSTKSTTYRSPNGTMYYYFLKRNGGTLYRTSANNPGIIADFGDYNSVSMLKLKSDGTLTSATPWSCKVYDGFYRWYPDEESYNLTGYKILYLSYGVPETGWYQVGSKWYYSDSKGLAQTGWQKLDGKYYYFNTTTGAMMTGWQQVDGDWYYMNSSGAMMTGWQAISGKWYYFNSDGAMLTGWQLLGGKYYYFNGSGAMLTGWQAINGKWYYLNSSGAMQTGWKQISGKWYFFESDGAMQTGWKLLGGKYYYFNGSGAMLTGWQAIGGKWYYLNSSGAMQTGWKQISGKWYFFESDGVMQTGWKTLGGKYYYFNGSGAMMTGWISSGGKWYYLSSSGAAQTGWLKNSGKWYLFDSNGVMLTGMQKSGGQTYYFNGSGAMMTGWQAISGKWYYFESSGAMAVNKWVGNYYLLSTGEMAVNQWIGGYYVGSDGQWIKGYSAA